MTSNFFFRFREDKSCLKYLISKLDLRACCLAISIFFFTKSTPVTFAPNLERGSQVRPPPHPKSSISKLRKGHIFYIFMVIFIFFFI